MRKLFFVLLFLGYLCPSNAPGHLAAATTSSLTPDTRAQLASPPPAIIGAHIVGDEYFEALGPTPDPVAISISRPKVSVSATQTTTRTNVFATSLVRVGPRCVRRRRKLSAVIEKVTTLASPKPTVDDQVLQPTPPPGLPSLRERTLMEMPDTATPTSSAPYGWQTGPVTPTDEDHSPPEQLSLLWMLLLICGAFTVALGGIIVKMDGLRGQRTAATEPEQVHTMPHGVPCLVAKRGVRRRSRGLAQDILLRILWRELVKAHRRIARLQRTRRRNTVDDGATSVPAPVVAAESNVAERPVQVAAPEDINVAAEAFAQAAAEGGFATGIQGQVVGDDVAEGPVLDDAGDDAAGDIGTKEPAQRDLGLAAATAVADEYLRIMAHSSTARQVANAQEAKVIEGH
ncbi:hypothetical protein H4218_000080 [Coemansia sp. IMI 209128]|nr:hypothetical protein H4218_000080 [Coemansia sp. IMI 209128]